jgi:recombination protein RecA
MAEKKPEKTEKTEKDKKDLTPEEQKAKALSEAIERIEKEHGKGSIMRLGAESVVRVPVIPTGCLAIDHAMGIGGLPRGRVIEIFGPESSGKTTLALHAVAEAQRLGGVAAFIDAEHALDISYAKRLGVNCDELLVSQPDAGEQALEIADLLISSGALDIVVIDSVAALVPQAEIDGDMGDSHMGLQARLMAQALRKLTATIHKTNTCLIFINQIRMKIGVMFGNPETTPGGTALKFFASARLEIRKMQTLKEGTDVLGHRTKVKVVKNKLAPPFKEVEFDVLFGEGISRVGDLLDMGVEVKVIEKSGAWYSFEGERLGQGRENIKKFFLQHPEVFDKAYTLVREKLGIAAPLPPPALPTSAPAREKGKKATPPEQSGEAAPGEEHQ